MAKSNPVNTPPKAPTPEAAQAPASAPAADPLEAFKIELPNGLTIYNFNQ